MLNTNLHRKYMFEILIGIFSSNFSKYLAFKGGTACYFLHSLDRFSTDLDFDLITEINENELLNGIGNILSKFGTIKESYNKQNTIFFLFSYGDTDMNIKVEINKRIWKSNKYEITNFYGTDIKVMGKTSIFANKLVALTDRKIMANRDIYDIWFFYKNNFSINEDLILERTGKSYKQYLELLINFLSKINKTNLLNGLGEVLNPKQKAFVKERLLTELIGKIEFELKFL